MIRFGKNVLSSLVSSIAAVSLAACGGGSHHSVLPSAAQTPTAVVPSDKLVQATFKIVIPAPTTTSAKARKPAYISQATLSVRINLTATDSAHNVNLAGGQFNLLTQVGAGPTGACSGSGPYTCTIAVMVPPGSDTFTFTTYDDTTGTGTGSSHILSQQIKTLTVVVGKANNPSTDPAYTITFDANAASLSISGTQACTSGSIGSSFGTAGTTPVVLNVSYSDLATKTIVAPGLPNLQVQANHSGDTAFHNNSGTIDGTGGSVDFAINQSTQTITLTPTTVPVSNVTVNVKATPPTADGLTFNQTKTFTFAAGTAPPAHNFIAIVEQNSAGMTGQINFFNVTLGGSGVTDTFTTFAAAPTLATTTSINSAPDGQQPDVDFPEEMTWDSVGSLLIANGGQGGAGGDFGNFACVPPGAIATGLALATTNRTGLYVPAVIALSSNGTVALGNNPAGATTKVQQFNLSTNYVTGSSYPDDGTLSYGIPNGRPLINLPSLTAGTFAFGLFNGTHSKFVVMGPTGTTSTITDSGDSQLQDPFGMAWDAVNSQVIIANQISHQSYLEWYTVSNPPAAPTKVGSMRLQPDPDPADDCPLIGGTHPPCSGMGGQKVAVAPTSGTIAVSGINGYNSPSGLPEIQLYNSSHSATGVIPFDTYDTGADACAPTPGLTGALYGTSTTIEELQWLSSTKLLVLLRAPNALSTQGIYIFDNSATAQPAGFWGPYSGGSCHSTMPPPGPKQTFFQNVQPLIPFAAAFKP